MQGRFLREVKKKIEECGDMKERNGSFPSGGTANTTVQAVHSAFEGTSAWKITREKLDLEER